jgi:hypothetical protein
MKTENQNLNAGPSSIVRLFGAILVLLVVTFVSVSAHAETTSDADIKALKKTVNELVKKIEKIENAEKAGSGSPVAFGSIPEKLHVGGYGELHANFGEGKDADLIDLHRLVIYLGYDFSDWISFHSETEIEHGFVTDGAGGELVIEQAYFEFLLSDGLNIRAGRVLTPLGITNQYHEPTLFNSVERSSFDKYIIPSTWSSDGIGIFGDLSDEVTYEAYVVGGLDGSLFSAKDGIRGGRIKERPGLHEPAFTGRIDYNATSDLRLGLSAYTGGLDNTNKSKNLTGVNADITIYSADFSYSVSKFDFTGAIAHTNIGGAENLNALADTSGVASETFGWYLEGAYHCWPKAWKKGKFAKTDAVIFARYDDYDTQYKMPGGTAANPAGDRNQITFGTAIRLTPNFVVKADYQISDDRTANDLGDKINLGIGFNF